MARSLSRMCSGVYKLIDRDHEYFYSKGKLAGRGSHFRDDLRAIVGGALAFGFVAAALTQLVNVPFVSDGAVTLIASAVGGVSGKFVLV